MKRSVTTKIVSLSVPRVCGFAGPLRARLLGAFPGTVSAGMLFTDWPSWHSRLGSVLPCEEPSFLDWLILIEETRCVVMVIEKTFFGLPFVPCQNVQMQRAFRAFLGFEGFSSF